MTLQATDDQARQRALVQLVCDVLPVWQRHLASSRSQSEAAVNQMVVAFGEIVPRLPNQNAAQRPAPDVSDAVERMYQGFQYEDRISQVVALLQQDMQRLLQALSESDTSLDAAQWLARLESGYVMEEQRQQHHAGDQAKPATDNDETTFF
ncbi:MAG: hypothetical protein AUJ20_09055 [Comamonadaceae bacterium CG1_02_60_18]|nr:MAG: hypothetical protein AUJ20_09055 [Comamonadaceae bacterium CG1_02_60_18]PIQ53016.1 MAG: hypothetical protein COW02_07985 [Comamonadaceae bacterium CG12_big_fil_rev_8_21_14_0_65_59_15]